MIVSRMFFEDGAGNLFELNEPNILYDLEKFGLFKINSSYDAEVDDDEPFELWCKTREPKILSAEECEILDCCGNYDGVYCGLLKYNNKLYYYDRIFIYTYAYRLYEIDFDRYVKLTCDINRGDSLDKERAEALVRFDGEVNKKWREIKNKFVQKIYERDRNHLEYLQKIKPLLNEKSVYDSLMKEENLIEKLKKFLKIGS